jgi:predicted N-acetyltransferase YhbS
MNFSVIDYNTAHTLPKSDFPLLWKHLEKRKSCKLYEEFPTMISYVVAEEDNKIVGIIGFESCKLGDDDYFYISPLEILEEYRNKGYGTLLLENVKDSSKAFKLKGVSLFCKEELVFFYSKRGFRVSNSIENENDEDFEYLMIFENKKEK